MKQKIVSIIVGVAVLILFLLMGRYGFTVVKIEDAEKAVQDEAFDPVTFVDDIWESRMIPAFEENSIELSSILSKIQLNDDGTASKESLVELTEEYGLITEGEAHVYMVKGTGVVTSVNAESSQGKAEITIDGYDGPIKVNVYIGTRIPSDDTSIRDAVGFIKFGDFKEQTEFGKVASELNKRVVQNLGPIDHENLVGKTISFEGGFTIRTFNLITINLENIYITPTEIDLGE
ncbi:MAG: DUF2291 domain-containing protein [Anaerolineaceae bacterium]|nr:DUF2291 domain-containing protein [Anaerolineaceae bacterium]